MRLNQCIENETGSLYRIEEIELSKKQLCALSLLLEAESNLIETTILSIGYDYNHLSYHERQNRIENIAMRKFRYDTEVKNLNDSLRIANYREFRNIVEDKIGRGEELFISEYSEIIMLLNLRAVEKGHWNPSTNYTLSLVRRQVDAQVLQLSR